MIPAIAVQILDVQLPVDWLNINDIRETFQAERERSHVRGRDMMGEEIRHDVPRRREVVLGRQIRPLSATGRYRQGPACEPG